YFCQYTSLVVSYSFFFRFLCPPSPTLFPYTTLFRSWQPHARGSFRCRMRSSATFTALLSGWTCLPSSKMTTTGCPTGSLSPCPVFSAGPLLDGSVLLFLFNS